MEKEKLEKLKADLDRLNGQIFHVEETLECIPPYSGKEQTFESETRRELYNLRLNLGTIQSRINFMEKYHDVKNI